MKTCTKCKTSKPLSDFHPRVDARQHKKAHQAWCKACHMVDTNARRRLNKARHREYEIGWMQTSKGRVSRMLISIRNRAKKLGYECDLTPDWLRLRVETGVCAATGEVFNLSVIGGRGKKNPLAPSVDRIDCSRGYTMDNCRVVTTIFNMARNDFGDEALARMAKGLLRTISSQASKEEGSTTIPQGSSGKCHETHSTPRG